MTPFSLDRLRLAALTLAALCAALASAPAHAADWTVDPDASRLTFEGMQTGKAFDGGFDEFTAEIALDPAAPETGSIRVVVDTGSFNTGAADRDAEAMKPDWFDTETYPEAVFVSDRIEATADGYVANGTLTIKDVSLPVSLPFTLEVEGDRAVAEGGMTVARLDYHLGVGDWADGVFVGLEVGIAFHVEADRGA